MDVTEVIAVRQSQGLSCFALCLGWADVAQDCVQTTGIVKAIRVSEQFATGLIFGGIEPMMDPFGLEGVNPNGGETTKLSIGGLSQQLPFRLPPQR